MHPALTVLFAAVQAMVVCRAAVRVRDRYLAFLLLALSLRYLLSLFPEVTHPKIAVGLSINAGATTLMTIVGLAVVAGPYLRARILVPFYLFFSVVLFSGLVNGELLGLATAASRLLYLLVLQVAMFAALERSGTRRVANTLLLAFIAPVGLQWASIVTGHHKLTGVVLDEWQSLETIGRSFVGSYGHESGFSMVLLTMLVLLLFLPSRSTLWFGLAVVLCAGGLMYANYRTAILAAVPLVFALVLARSYRAIVPRQRAVAAAVLGLVAVGALAGAVAGSERLQARFSDLADIPVAELLLSPDQLTGDERDVLSGRINIWSGYIGAYASADLPRLLVGFGPEAWQHMFRFYAHNTFVSFLYEFGALGLAAFLFYWASNIVCGLRAGDGMTVLRLLAAYAGFTVLNLATMPLWQVEGLILFALINGIAMHELSQRVARHTLPEARTQARGGTLVPGPP